MTDTDNTEDTRPPMPTEEPKPGYKWTFVPVHVRGGKTTKPMWRQMPLKKSKEKPEPKRRGRPPHSERPRFTSPNHATYLRDRLAVPLTLLVTLRHMTPNADPDLHNIMHECIGIIKEVRLFVGRFTSNKPMEE